MKGLFLALRQFLILWCLLFFLTRPCHAETQKKLNYLGLLVNGTLEEKLNQIFSLINSYYKNKEYEKVIEVYKRLPPFLPLKSQENLMIARSFLNVGEPQNAIKFADKVISLKLITEVCCKARLVKIEALSVLGKTKEALQEIKALNKTFCAKEFENEISSILYYLGKASLRKLESIPPEVVKSVLEEIYRARVLYLIKQNKLDQALKDAFVWLNIYGDYKKGSELIFKIAEAFLSSGQTDKANTLYELIITEWKTQKEATFARFRLYQIAYQNIKIKELIPQKMIDDLIFYIELLKKKYPEEKITQEAHFFELKLFLQYQNWYKLKKEALNFFTRYPEGPYTKKAKVYYCKANFNILENLHKHNSIKKIIQLVKTEENYLEQAQCGNIFYFMGKLYWDYHFELASTYYFIKAFENQPPKRLLPKNLLYLNVLAERQGEKDLFPLLFSYFEKNYGKGLVNSPWFCYLKALVEVEKGTKSADIWLKKALNSKLDSVHKVKLLRVFRNWALKRGEYEKALSYTLTDGFNPSPEDFILLLAWTFSKDSTVFEKTLKVAEKLYPKNFQIKWLAAYFYEKNGKIKQANKLWQEITSGNSYESALARNYENFKKFLKKAQKLAF